MSSYSMKPAKYFYDKPLPKYLDPKTVLIYLLHPVGSLSSNNSSVEHRICSKLKGKEDFPRVIVGAFFGTLFNIEPRTVATLALTVRCLYYSDRSHPLW
jgi:hypothetical protein